MGYWSDRRKQRQQAELAPEPQEMQPPPKPAFWERALQGASNLSLADQDFGLLTRLPQRLEEIDRAGGPSAVPARLVRNLLRPAEVIGKPIVETAGKAVAAPFAALGANLPGSPGDKSHALFGFAGPQIREDSADKMQAFREGTQVGGEEAVKQVTPMNVAGILPLGRAATFINYADMALGAGDVYRGIKEKDPTAVGLGAFRMAGNAAANMLHAPHVPEPTSPKVSAATAAAKQQAQMPELRYAESNTQRLPVTPEARNAVDFLANQALRAINETIAKGGFEGAFPGEVPTALPTTVMMDPTFKGLASVDIPGGRIRIGDIGVNYVLQGATDARGVMDRLLTVISHEVQHGTEVGSGMPGAGVMTRPGGHATGAVDDDRLQAFTQQFRDMGIREAAKNHPLLADAAAAVERVGLLKDAYLPAATASAEGMTYPIRDLQLFHGVMETPQEQIPVVPMTAVREQAKMPAYPELEEPGMAAPGDKDKMSRALTGRQLKLPGARFDDLARDLPEIYKLKLWAEAGREGRTRFGAPNAERALEQLEKAYAEGRLGDVAHAKSLGIERGTLWPIYNNLDKATHIGTGVNRKFKSPEAEALWKRLRAVVARYPRAFSQAPRDLGTNPRNFGKLTPGDLAPQAGTPRAEALQARRDVINAGREVTRTTPKLGPAEPEHFESVLQRFQSSVERLKGMFKRLTSREMRPGIDAVKGVERQTKRQEFEARAAERRRLKGEGKKPPEGNEPQMGSGFRDDFDDKFGKNLKAPPRSRKGTAKKELFTSPSPLGRMRMIREEATSQPKSLSERLEGFKKNLESRAILPEFFGKVQSDQSILARLKPDQAERFRKDPEYAQEVREAFLQKKAKVGETGQLPSQKPKEGEFERMQREARGELHRGKSAEMHEPLAAPGVPIPRSNDPDFRLKLKKFQAAIESALGRRTSRRVVDWSKEERLPKKLEGPSARPTTPEEQAGAKKAAPTKYRGTEDIEPLRRKILTENPMRSAARGSEADQAAITRIKSDLKAGVQVNDDMIDGAGFTPATRLRAKIALRRAKNAKRDLIPREIVSRFNVGLDELFAQEMQKQIKEPQRTGRLPREEGPSRAKLLQTLAEKQEGKRPLLKEAAKLAPEGKLSPFFDRSGPALSRKEGSKTVLTWVDELGNEIDETVGHKNPMAKELKDLIGLRVKPERMQPAAAPDRRLSIETSKILTVKKLVEDISKKIQDARVAGRPTARLQKLFDKITGSTFYKETGRPLTVPEKGVEYFKTPAKPTKRVPEAPFSMNPLKDKYTGGRAKARMPKTPGQEALGRGDFGITGSGAWKRLKKYADAQRQAMPVGELNKPFVGGEREGLKPSEREAGLTEAAKYFRRTRAAATATSVKARRKFLDQGVKDGMEQIEILIHKLGANGMLRNLAEQTAASKTGYDYRNLLEDFLDGKRIDVEDEYYLNRGELNTFKKKLERKLENEWAQQMQEAAEERVKFRASQRTSKAIEEVVGLPRETQEWLSKQTTPHGIGGGTVTYVGKDPIKGPPSKKSNYPGITEWVDAAIAREDLKPTERDGAIAYLREKARGEIHDREAAATKEITDADREAYRMKGRKKLTAADLDERIALQMEKEAEDNSPNPWDEEPEIGRGFTTAEVEALAEKSKGLSRAVKKSGVSRNWENIIETGGEWANITRPLKTAVDVSNPFRQTFQLTTDQITQDLLKVATAGRYGKTSDTSLPGNLWRMVKSFASESGHKARMAALQNDPWYKFAQESGVNFIHEGARHEAWIGKQALDKAISKVKNVPIIKQAKWLIDGSERAFNYYQDKAMRDAFKFGIEYSRHLHDLKTRGRTLSPTDIKTLSEFINNAASRGRVLNSPEWNKRLNYVLYSGQMNMSRIRMMADALTGFRSLGNPRLTRYARMQAVRSIAGASAAIGLIYSIAALTKENPTIELDPRSTDFGKINMGDITYDDGGGWLQFMRVGAQLSPYFGGKEKERGTGILKPKSRAETITNFIRSKLGPGASTFVDALAGRTVEGDPIDFKTDPGGAVSTLVWNILTPMSVDDVLDIERENPRVRWLIPLMLLGNGVSENLGRGVKAWRTTEGLREKERSNRMELRKRGVYQPTLSSRVTLNKRDSAGKLQHYNLSPAEREEFEKEYMPLVTTLLNEFLASKAYQSLPESKKRAYLTKKVHQLNSLYGANTRLRKKVNQRFKAGEIEAATPEPNEEMIEMPFGGRVSKPKFWWEKE